MLSYEQVNVRNGSKAPFQVSASHFRSTPINGHHQTGAVGPVGARSGDRENCKCNMAKRQSTFPASQSTTEKSPTGKSAKTCPALLTKIFRLTRRANHLYKLAPSHPDEGRIASRHERAVGCDGRDSVGRAMGSQGGSFP
jgi:hypothetical protein